MNINEYVWYAGDTEIEELAKDERFKSLIADFVNKNVVQSGFNDGCYMEAESRPGGLHIKCVGSEVKPGVYHEVSVSFFDIIREWIDSNVSGKGDARFLAAEEKEIAVRFKNSLQECVDLIGSYTTSPDRGGSHE